MRQPGRSNEKEPTPCIRTASAKQPMAAPPAPCTSCPLHHAPCILHPPPGSNQQHLPSRNRAAHGNEPDRNCTAKRSDEGSIRFRSAPTASHLKQENSEKFPHPNRHRNTEDKTGQEVPPRKTTPNSIAPGRQASGCVRRPHSPASESCNPTSQHLARIKATTLQPGM